MKKDNVYARADEKFVKTVVLYANTSKVLFYDKEAKTDKVAKADLKELFEKGIVIAMNNDLYAPVCLKTTGIVSYDGSAAVTFTGSDLE